MEELKRRNKVCAKVSWRDSAGHQSCPAKVSRPAGIDVDVSGGNEWCEASQLNEYLAKYPLPSPRIVHKFY